MSSGLQQRAGVWAADGASTTKAQGQCPEGRVGNGAGKALAATAHVHEGADATAQTPSHAGCTGGYKYS